MVTNPSTRIKRAFVTGATGIVGASLCRKLVDIGVDVKAYSRSAGAQSLPQEVEYIQGDILDVPNIVTAAAEAEVIFHLAAAVHGSVSTDSQFEEMNVIGTSNVINAADVVGAKFIHVSTVNVKGFRDGYLTDAYAVTKSRAEDLVAESACNGLRTVTVRAGTVFGNEVGRAGSIVERLLSNSLKVLPAPDRKISPVWSDDLAMALIRASDVGELGRTYTVAGPTQTTSEFVKAICSAGNFNKPLIYVPAWLFAVPLQLAWWGKTLTRWAPPVSVESLLNESIHDGSEAANELGFTYTPLDQIFG